ncbi:MAG: aminotransferase class I/II-fold pyridoxal phosphate-dependent enzyme, partial [Pseudomonadota bacterium]
MTTAFLGHVANTLDIIRSDGLYKVEREITSPQSGTISVSFDGAKHADVINLCANNYLGLANHPNLILAAQKAMTEYGYGMSSVRFICGTQDLHRELERRLA